MLLNMHVPKLRTRAADVRLADNLQSHGAPFFGSPTSRAATAVARGRPRLCRHYGSFLLRVAIATPPGCVWNDMRTNAIVLAALLWMSHVKLARVHMYSPIVDVEMSRKSRVQRCK